MTDHSRQLGEGSIPRLLLRFSIPAIVGMVAHSLYNVVDRIFVGRAAGVEGIAAITVCLPAMLIIMGFVMLIGLGANSLVSIKLGERKKEDAEVVFGNAIVLLILAALVLSMAGLAFLDPVLRIFGSSEAILPLSRSYLRIVLIGTVFQFLGFGMNNFIRGEGNPRIAMLTMLIGAALNIVLDPILIFGFGMGVKGAALATVISMAISSAWVVSYFLSEKSTLRIRFQNFRVRWEIARPIISIGSPPFAMHIAASVLNSILNNQLLAYGGELAISVMGIIFSLVMIILMPVFGINQGVQPIIGYNYGARRFDRVKKALLLAIAAATMITTVGFVISRFFPVPLIRLFSENDPELVELGAHAMGIFLMMLPVVGFQIVSANYFQAVGKPKQALFLSLSRQLILLIPAIVILPRFFGLDGLWFSGPASDFGSSVLSGIWLFFELRNLDLKQRESVACTAASARFPL